MSAYNGYYDRTTHQALPNLSHSSLDQTLRMTVVYVGITAGLIYYLLIYLDYPILPIQEILWNFLVYMIPSRIIFALDRKISTSDTDAYAQEDSGAKSKEHAAKSEAMRRILGLDKGGGFAGFRRARSLSGIGYVFKGAQGDVPPGLGNWDNSCYQNSVIQGLASLQSLRDFLRYTMDDPTQASLNSTINALRDMIERLNKPSNAGRRLWTPAELKNMSSWQQQDAQEYFSKVLDEVDKELQKAARSGKKGVGLSEVAESLSDQDHATYEEEARKRTLNANEPFNTNKSSISVRWHSAPNKLTTLLPNLPKSPLEGLLAQRVGCLRCGHVEGLSLIPFNCLTVPLSRECYQDIQGCLEAYTVLEPIEGVECAKCTLLRSKEQLEHLLCIPANVIEAEDKHKAAMLSEVLRKSAKARLTAVNETLENEDFSENTVTKRCQIPSRGRVATRKSRQAIIARAPSSLVIHVNRSVFDEISGIQTKNYAAVSFPTTLDIAPLCLGIQPRMDGEVATEEWITDPRKSMIPDDDGGDSPPKQTANYGLRAVITHYGRHENGHYICYRKHPKRGVTDTLTDENTSDTKVGVAADQWWRLSDDEVTMVSEQNVLDQGGVFMLFYERLDDPKVPEPALPPSYPREPAVDVVAEAAQCIREESVLVVNGEKPALSLDEPPILEPRTTFADPKPPHKPQNAPPIPQNRTESPFLQALPDPHLNTIPHQAPGPCQPTAPITPTKDSDPEEPPSQSSITHEKPSPQKEKPRRPLPMRTAGPHRKGAPRRRAGNAMSSTSSMISAN